MRWGVTLVVAWLLPFSIALADQEAPNEPIAVAAQDGSCYAKSVPLEEYGERGLTQVFRVERGADTLIHKYSWFAREIYVKCMWVNNAPRVSVVQLGPWPRGRVADRDTLAIAFYFNGRLLKRYSTLDIAGAPGNVKPSSNHYTVLDKVIGYRWGTARQRFVVRTIDNRTLVFDSETGVLVDDELVDVDREW